jgi:vitamin B12 transporter
MKILPSIFLFFVLLQLSVFSESPAESENPITTTEEIVVTARRTSQNYSQVPENITVITAKELSQIPVNNLSDALNLVTGVDLQSRGPLGQASPVTIQGCDPRQVRIMVDGVLLNSQGMAMADPSQIPIENIERIEIIKGTASAVWGSSLGGVINVITKSPLNQKELQGSLTTVGGWGSYGSSKTILGISGNSDNFGYLFWLSTLDTNDGFRANSAIMNQQFSTKLNYSLSNQSSLEASFHYNGADIGGYEFPDDTIPYGEDFFYNLRYGSLKFSTSPQEWMEFNATAKASNQYSRVKDYSLPTGTVTNDAASKNVFSGLDLQSKLLIADNQTLLIGIDFGRDQLDSDLMTGREKFGRYANYVNYLLNIGEQYSITLGGRYDNNTAFGQEFSPSAGIVYHLPYWQTDLRLSVAQAFNAPPLVFKYATGMANPDLKAERATAVYELSAETKPQSDLWVKLALYRAEIKDYAEFDWSKFIMDNIGRIRRQGVESELKYNVLKDLQTQAGLSFNRVQDRETGAIVQNGAVAKLTYNLGLNYNYQNEWNLILKGNYRFWNEPANSKPNDRNFIWDARFNYNFGSSTNNANQTSAFIGLFNIFNTDYWADERYPLPGRRIEAGLKYSF